MFIGPTSQAPRVDETRADAVYELEIAFEQLTRERGASHARRGSSIASSATCWSTSPATRTAPSSASTSCTRPTASTGRLGLRRVARLRDAAARADEPRAAAAAARAARPVLARAVRRATPIRWGTRLHDRFLLPHFVEQDFADVIADLRAAGYPLDAAWFAPHLEFRFPVYGRVRYDGVEIELRQAIEPWYVLGEEPGARRHGALRRFVGRAAAGAGARARSPSATSSRATAGGCRCSRPARTASSSAACAIGPGSRRAACIRRFRCTRRWCSTSSTWRHAAPSAAAPITSAIPAGGTTTTFPVNSNEAEARRRARFFAFGHTPGSPTDAGHAREPRVSVHAGSAAAQAAIASRRTPA